jgi:hypothetical protein
MVMTGHDYSAYRRRGAFARGSISLPEGEKHAHCLDVTAHFCLDLNARFCPGLSAHFAKPVRRGGDS